MLSWVTPYHWVLWVVHAQRVLCPHPPHHTCILTIQGQGELVESFDAAGSP